MRLRILLLIAVSCAACAPVPYRAGQSPGPYTRVYPYAPRYTPEPASSSVVGRWDNVMLLPAGTSVVALMFDGRKAGGQVTFADAATLRLLTASGEAAFAADTVMRVDRVAGEKDYGAAVGRGAALGAGVVGVMGLLAGHVPPARVFAAGAIMGAGASLQDMSYAGGPVVIYLSPRVRGGGVTP